MQVNDHDLLSWCLGMIDDDGLLEKIMVDNVFVEKKRLEKRRDYSRGPKRQKTKDPLHRLEKTWNVFLES